MYGIYVWIFRNRKSNVNSYESSTLEECLNVLICRTEDTLIAKWRFIASSFFSVNSSSLISVDFLLKMFCFFQERTHQLLVIWLIIISASCSLCLQKSLCCKTCWLSAWPPHLFKPPFHFYWSWTATRIDTVALLYKHNWRQIHTQTHKTICVSFQS